MWKIIKDLFLGITKSLVCRILELTGFIGSIIAFIKYQKEGINSAYSICKAQKESLWRCFMSNLDSGTIWLIAAFLLMFSGFFFRWLRSKLSPTLSHYERHITAIKNLYHYLEFFPYDAPDINKFQYMGSFATNPFVSTPQHNKISISLDTLLDLIRHLYKEEGLKNALVNFQNYFYPSPKRDGMIYPIFESRTEFYQKQKQIKNTIDIAIKYLENNRVS
jgi:hypothetical protein